MRTRERKWLRRFGKLLFLLYIVFLFWFLLFSDWYGRGGEMREYHYNLELFREIRRFWTYREQLGFLAFANLAGNVLILCRLVSLCRWRADPGTGVFSYGILQFWN